MSVSVRIPSLLRSFADDAAQVEVSGSTVAEVLADVEATFPGLTARILEDSGELRRFVTIYVDEIEVRSAQGLATPTPDGSHLSIIFAVAGGC